MYVLLLIVVTALKILLCKGLVLGIILLLVWIKGRQLRFDSDEWDNFFLSLPPEKIQQGAIGIYLAAAVISSVISYCILELAGYRHSLGIAVLIFIGGLAITAYQWHKKGREYLLKRYQEIPETILERKEREHSENE